MADQQYTLVFDGFVKKCPHCGTLRDNGIVATYKKTGGVLGMLQSMQILDIALICKTCSQGHPTTIEEVKEKALKLIAERVAAGSD